MCLKRIYFIILAMLLACNFSYGQDRLLRGRVTTFDSIPLIDATIKVKSTKEVLQSDTLGNFSVYCNSPEKLKVSAKGFISRTIKVESGKTLVMVNLKLKPTTDAVEIATGYGHVKDSEKLQSMATLNNKDLDFSMYRNVFEIIRGRFPGVSIEGGEIIIRGKSSLLGSNAALIILDGIPVSSSSVNTVSPQSIKSINIFKG